MRIIAFIADIHKALEHIGVEPQAPRTAPACGPPLWDDCGAQEAQEQWEVDEALPDWEMTRQSAPGYHDDCDDCTGVGL